MVDLDIMEELLNTLCKKSYKTIIINLKEEFVTLPLKDWLTRIKASREETTIQDVSSVETFLETFK